jgi:hypothetical protein
MRRFIQMGAGVALAVAVVGCEKDKPQIEKVDITAENKPPLAVTVAGAGLTMPVGIGVAVVVQPYIEGKASEVGVDLTGSNVVVKPGRDKNEFFVVASTVGTGRLTVKTAENGSLDVPTTVTEQK